MDFLSQSFGNASSFIEVLCDKLQSVEVCGIETGGKSDYELFARVVIFP